MRNKGKRVTRPEPQPMMAPPSITKTDEWEQWVVQHADHFTVVWKSGPGRMESMRFPTLAKAISYANESPRRMVYAVMNVGRSVMVGPKQYQAFLQIRGEQTS